MLPGSLEHLTFGHYFDSDVGDIHLLHGLKSLTFGDKFNHSFTSTQFPNLEALRFGCCFDQPLSELPANLKNLTLGNDYYTHLEHGSLPQNLQSLTFEEVGHRRWKKVHSGSICHFSDRRFTWPEKLQALTLASKCYKQFSSMHFPQLQSLTLGGDFNESLGTNLPHGLLSLTLGDRYDMSLEGVTLPSALQHLTFGEQFNQTLEPISLPETLVTLTFGREFNQSLDQVRLPQSLEGMTFGDHFNRCVDDITWPCHLQELIFGKSFDHELHLTFPSKLRRLTFGYFFNSSLEGIVWPMSLKSLTFGEVFINPWHR